MIQIKTEEEIKIMKEGGKRLSYVLSKTLDMIAPGVSTYEIDVFADNFIQKMGGTASFKRVSGYHWATCICINDCVVHGIPSKDTIIAPNDVVTVDIGMYYKKFHTDTSWTIQIKKNNREKENTNQKTLEDFLLTGEKALDNALSQVKIGRRVGDISRAIQNTVEPKGYSIAENLVGHGIGRKLHEDPEIPGKLYMPVNQTPLLKRGMVIAVEVIYMMGSNRVYVERDGWTIRTKDGTIASCFEKTIALARKGAVILT